MVTTESATARRSVPAGMPSCAKLVGSPISLYEVRQRFDSCTGGLLVRRLWRDAPDVLREAGKARRAAGVYVPLQYRLYDRQPLASVAVGVRAELVLYHVRLKVRDLADFQHAVLRHRGRHWPRCARRNRRAS